MPELRKDPIVNRWVIIASERARRPFEFATIPHPPPSTGLCPFCPGQESRTPPELLSVRPSEGPGARGNAPGWSLRVFPNKFPALIVEGDLDRRGEGVYDRMHGVGAHEVVVETPDHERTLQDLDEPQIAQVFAAYRDRMLDLSRDLRLKYVMVFKNHGRAAGATMSHAHSQLIALPVVPKVVSDEMDGARDYYAWKERCVFCDIWRQEVKERERLVYENADFVVIEPYAPRFPFETWVVPRRHRSAFEETPREELPSLANAMKVALGRLDLALDRPPYNYMLHSAPFGDRHTPHYHWHIEIIPTLSQVAGFEWGSGFYINPTPPEDAARYLRELGGEGGR